MGNIIQKGGSILHTSRSSRFLSKEYRDLGKGNLSKRNITSVIVIGGEGSLKGAEIFSRETDLVVLGIPATIDRDIPVVGPTIGFDTAINTALQAIDKIRDTASTSNTVHIIELMGRNCGWISLFAGIGGGAEAVIIPEISMNIDKLARQIQDQRSSGKQGCILIVSEGACNSSGGEGLVEALNSVSTFDLRITKLGHIQRGGNPSAVDRVLASRLGSSAVDTVLKGFKNCVVAQPTDQIKVFKFDDLKSDSKTDIDDYYQLILKLV